MTVVESTPFELPQMLSDKGVVFVRNFKREFEENSGLPSGTQFNVPQRV